VPQLELRQVDRRAFGNGNVIGRTGSTAVGGTTPNGAPNGKTSLDAFQEVIVGTKINF